MSCCDMSLGTLEQIQPQKPADVAALAVEGAEGEFSHDSLHREDFEQWILKVRLLGRELWCRLLISKRLGWVV